MLKRDTKPFHSAAGGKSKAVRKCVLMRSTLISYIMNVLICCADQQHVKTCLLLLIGLSLISLYSDFLHGGDKPFLPPNIKYVKTEEENVSQCQRLVKLTPYQQSNVSSDKIFFFETSGRPTLNPRQACAVESAARHSGVTNVVVLMNAEYLRFDGIGNDFLCALYARRFDARIRFHRLDLDADFKDTPLVEMLKKGAFQESTYPSTHLSDALRLVYLYKVRMTRNSLLSILY